MKSLILTSIISFTLSTALLATEIKRAPTPSKDTAKTTLGLYVKAKDAQDYLQKDKDAILIDVRTPSELMFIGMSKRVDFHIPFKILDSSIYSKKTKAYNMKKNKYFLKEILFELKKAKTNKNTPIFITCRSGSTRSAPVVNILAKEGFTNVWTITDGFQGSKQKDGKLKGQRVINGLQHSGYEWSTKLDKNKIWYKCKYKDLYSIKDKKECTK
ncbi:sulfurtransferase [Malaciobacter molluscorum]|uniref:rhodanese-like domain-containing protein n=1 Tax=Malaciobacter molluscorum TaxID=1032072 RepID=UPI00100B9400|nr:rhodanese-like domain-containing protein [Malaciobacter molluscorum]RXJ93545.1 sulfurtransferase [Malaciobacter molluscorum]